MKKTNKSLTIVSMLMIILLTFGCQSKRNAGYLQVITDPTHLNYPEINASVSKDLEKNWFTGLFTKEVFNDLLNAGIGAATGNYGAVLTGLVGAASTAAYAMKSKKLGNLVEEVADYAFDKADPELKQLAQKLKKGNTNAKKTS